MLFAFRADASATTGSGHVMRCLSLAERLVRRGHDVFFMSRALPETLRRRIARVAGRRAAVKLAAGDDARRTAAVLAARRPDWLIVDHYGLGAAWERAVRPAAGKLLAVDDLGRRHAADALLDVGAASSAGSVPRACRRLSGPRYALLRREFLEARRGPRRKTPAPRRVLVCFGGADPTGETEKALRALEPLAAARRISVEVVVGGLNPRKAAIRRGARRARVSVDAAKMAVKMVRADLALGAGGMMSFERCCVGLPALILTVADNQRKIAALLHRAGAAWDLGPARRVTAAALRARVEKLLGAPALLRRCAARALKSVDGRGADRVADVLVRP